MDGTNRSIIIGGALVWIALALLVIITAWVAPDQSIDKLADFAGYLNHHNDTGAQLVVTFGGLILILLAAMVLVLEVAPAQSGSVRVTRVGSGDARIGTDEVQQRLEEELRGTPGLGDVQVAVAGRGRKAEARLDLYLASDKDIAAVTDAACRRTRELMEGRMGMELATPPQAKIHFRDVGASQMRSTAEAPATRSPFAPPAEPHPLNTAPPSSEAHGTATETAPEDRAAGA